MAISNYRTSFRSLFKAYGVGFSILLLSASFYYVRQGYINQLVTIQAEVQLIETFRTAALAHPSCSKAGADKGLCAAQMYEKFIAEKQWTDTGKTLNLAATIAFLSRMKKAPPLSCGLTLKEIEMFQTTVRMEQPRVNMSKNMAKKYKAKMGRTIASTKFKEPKCTSVVMALKKY